MWTEHRDGEKKKKNLTRFSPYTLSKKKKKVEKEFKLLVTQDFSGPLWSSFWSSRGPQRSRSRGCTVSDEKVE